jgi:predicted transcriptional regulator
MCRPLRQFLEEIAAEKAPGPSLKFSVFHMLIAIELVAEKPTGRNKLAQKLNVGEGTVRTLVGRLKNAGLITISKGGCSLTKEGLGLWKEFSSIFKKVEIGKSELTGAEYNFAVLIRNQGHKLKSGMEQRDAAIMAGAKNATTIVFKEGKLTIPSVSSDLAKDFPKAANQLKALQPKQMDAIIIAGADSLEKAEYGAVAAVWTLLHKV